MTTDKPILNEHVGINMNEMLDTLVTHLEQIKVLTANLIGAMPCRQFQLIAMDAESIHDHLVSLSESGPLEVFLEIPLEESEIDEDEMMWKEPEHGGQSMGDEMMTNGKD